MKNHRASLALWVFLVLVMMGSLTHTAWLFSLRENDDNIGKAISYGIAIAIDAGLAGVIYGIRLRKAQQRKATFLYVAAGLILLVSIYANFSHAFAQDIGGEMTIAGWQLVDTWRLITSLVVSVPLPLLTLALTETVGDDAVYNQEHVATMETTMPDTATKQATRKTKAENTERRQEALAMLATGAHTPSEVAAIMQVSRSTVSKWQKKNGNGHLVAVEDI